MVNTYTARAFVLLCGMCCHRATGAVPALPSAMAAAGRRGATSSSSTSSSSASSSSSAPSLKSVLTVGPGGGSRISSIGSSSSSSSLVANSKEQLLDLSGGAVNLLAVVLKAVVNVWAPLAAVLFGLNHLFPHLKPDLLACWHRLVAGGFVVSFALVILAVPQACRLSGGVLPAANAVDIAAILGRALPTQTMFKTVQYFCLRSLKFGLDGLSWMPSKTLNTIVSYGLTATVMQCAAYNNAIKNTYAHYGLAQLIFYKYDKNHNGSIDKKELAAALKDAKCSAEDSAAVMAEFGGGKIGLPEFKQLIAKCSALQAARSSSIFTMFAGFLKANVLPGMFFSFVRECGATGAGIVVSPKVRTALAPLIGDWHPVPAKILSGIMGGMFCSLMTQWLHNNSLRAGNLYQYTGKIPSTFEVLDLTWKELGWRMFYVNANRRVLSTATATTALTVIDIFK